ncbi:hypothetical protein [Streptomyces sp. NPDC091268]|uniref:hypothetical protein n=1 Tax=Streptomyces sp. NPDC091268 TaxID=3365979 RepID=UPI0037FE4EE5
MLTETAYGDSRSSFWPRVREFAVPPSMIETATARRTAGDWAGACAAAGVDVDFNLRSLARTHGRAFAARVRSDLRHLAPDLLRWHMPRIAPDGLLRPGLTLTLARYGAAGPDVGSGPVHLVARTAPAWADSGQRISLALWDESGSGAGRGSESGSEYGGRPHPHPHPRPHPRFRLDLHRHLWDARRSGELWLRAVADGPPLPPARSLLPPEHGCAVHRWAAEAAILLRAEGRTGGAVAVRAGARHRLLLEPEPEPGPGGSDGSGGPAAPPGVRLTPAPPQDGGPALPLLPEAATWLLPDLELLRSGAVDPDRLHPLVASALVPSHTPAGPPAAADPPGRPRVVECRGERHRIGLVDGVLAPLDHHPDELRREELLVALTGTPLPCLRAIDEAHRRPDCLTGVRERLDHGDTAGALAVVEGLLGPGALLRAGPLRDALEAAARQRITYGLFRAGLAGPGPGRIPSGAGRPRHHRSHPRNTTAR